MPIVLDTPKRIFFLSLTIAGLLILPSLLAGKKAVTNGLIIGALASIFCFVVAWWVSTIIINSN